jgi:sigma-B regulation protein RsbU (phosphoserine phosphatase)
VTELEPLLDRFMQATACDAVVWMRSGDTGPLRVVAGRTSVAPPPVVELLPPGGPPAAVETDRGVLYVAAVAGPRRAWVGVGPCRDAHIDPVRFVDFLALLVANAHRARLEVEHAAFELAERYEEINLLYTTSEIFGRTVSLEEAAARILEEIADTVGAGRGALLVHDRVTDTLQVVTALGFDPKAAEPIAVTDPRSATARVFREQRAVIVEPGADAPRTEPYHAGSLLSVPILWTNPGHPPVPLGVVNLSGRRTGAPFTSGDEKLVSAIATQIGTAIQINRLVRASVSQQRMQQELQLANDLQMKLLPKTSQFLPEAEIAARVVPAESVGGDFYHLFRLGDGRTGVMMGDVSSHGYRAALIMALVMSAASIHAQTTADPQEMLNAILATIADELESTEMFVSAFYGVIDPYRRRIRYANAGHPHAFIAQADGCIERLPAGAPPLGMSTDVPETAERHWDPGSDLLVLFTDGMADARDRFDQRFGEDAVLEAVREHQSAAPAFILEQVLARLQQHTGDVIRRDDLTMVIARA